MKQYLANTLLGVLFLGGLMALYPNLVMPGWERELRMAMRGSLRWGYFPAAVTTSAYTTIYTVSEDFGRAVTGRSREELSRALLEIDAEEPRRGYVHLITRALEINKLGQRGGATYAEIRDGKGDVRRLPMLQYVDSRSPKVQKREWERPRFEFRTYSLTDEGFTVAPKAPPIDYTEMTLIGR